MSPEVVWATFLSFLSAAVLALLGWLIQRWLKGRPAAPSIPEMWAPMDKLEERVTASEKREHAALTETAEIKGIIARWFSDLRNWNRVGNVPMPRPDDMKKLGLPAD